MMKDTRSTSIGITLLACAALFQSPALAASADAVEAAEGVKVTVSYTGKGNVDSSHKLWIWLFDTPDIGPGAIPIGEQSLDNNGGTAAFADVTAKTVWIAVAYDSNGGFGGSAPPPSGSPVTLYGLEKGAPEGVTPGDTSEVSVKFDDSQRMP